MYLFHLCPIMTSHWETIWMNMSCTLLRSSDNDDKILRSAIRKLQTDDAAVPHVTFNCCNFVRWFQSQDVFFLFVCCLDFPLPLSLSHLLTSKVGGTIRRKVRNGGSANWEIRKGADVCGGVGGLAVGLGHVCSGQTKLQTASCVFMSVWMCLYLEESRTRIKTCQTRLEQKKKNKKA